MAIERKYCDYCDGEGLIYDSNDMLKGRCPECEGNCYEWVIVGEENEN